MSKIQRCRDQPALFQWNKITTLKHQRPSDLVETKEVGVMFMSKIIGVRYVHKNSVGFLQLQGGGEVTLCGPGVPSLLRAEASSVGPHQVHRCGAPRSPHKHRVNERGRRGAVLKDQLYPRVNVVQSGLVDLQGAVLIPVRHPSGYECPTCLRLPPQSLREFYFLNPPHHVCCRSDVFVFFLQLNSPFSNLHLRCIRLSHG